MKGFEVVVQRRCGNVAPSVSRWVFDLVKWLQLHKNRVLWLWRNRHRRTVHHNLEPSPVKKHPCVFRFQLSISSEGFVKNVTRNGSEENLIGSWFSWTVLGIILPGRLPPQRGSFVEKTIFMVRVWTELLHVFFNRAQETIGVTVIPPIMRGEPLRQRYECTSETYHEGYYSEVTVARFKESMLSRQTSIWLSSLRQLRNCWQLP
jgi:hypothetical protein